MQGAPSSSKSYGGKFNTKIKNYSPCLEGSQKIMNRMDKCGKYRGRGTELCSKMGVRTRERKRGRGSLKDESEKSSFAAVNGPQVSLLLALKSERGPQGLRGGCLPSAQGVTLGSRDRVPHRGPCMEPASPSACVSASLSVSLMSKYIKC